VALEDNTRERAPLHRAAAQDNRGSALAALEGGTLRLTEAGAAHRAALEECTREREPLRWAGKQNNLADALTRLGERGSGAMRFAEAVTAHGAALGEHTGQLMPDLWAQTKENLALAEPAWGSNTRDPVHWRAAPGHIEAASEEYQRVGAAFDVENASCLRDDLAARLAPR
jgi:hypothetical protein